MADITKLFLAVVRTVRSQQRAFGETVNVDKSILQRSNKTGNQSKSSAFAKNAAAILVEITKLKEYLLLHAKDYVNIGSILSSLASDMTDRERDQIDSDAQRCIQACNSTLGLLRETTLKGVMCTQLREHCENVLNLLDSYLRSVCKIYSEQRAIRVKRMLDQKRSRRLQQEHVSASELNTDIGQTDGFGDDADREVSFERNVQSAEQSAYVPEMEEVTQEEAQMFAEENQQLFEEMSSVAREVQAIESNVIEITKLQEIFTEKVLQQEKVISRIEDTALGTTENIREANDEIRSAMKTDAGFRVWILFFLVVLSFSLLFLDWYND